MPYPFKLLELTAKNFTRRKFGKTLDKLHLAQFFIACELTIHKRDELNFGDVRALVADENDKGLGYFTGFLVRHTDNNRLLDSMMLHEHCFQFGWGNAKAFVFNHIFLTIHKIQVPLRIQVTNISSVDPPIS